MRHAKVPAASLEYCVGPAILVRTLVGVDMLGSALEQVQAWSNISPNFPIWMQSCI